MSTTETAPDLSAATSTGLLARLANETDEAIASCLRMARNDADTLLEHAARHTDIALHEQVDALTRAHHDESVRIRALTEQRVRGSLLDARAAAIERVIDATVAQAHTLATHPDLPALLRGDIVRALCFLPEGRVVVKCPPVMAQVVHAVAESIKEARITVEPDVEMPFGIVLQSEDGRVEVNATIARTIAGQRSHLDIRIAQLLLELPA